MESILSVFDKIPGIWELKIHSLGVEYSSKANTVAAVLSLLAFNGAALPGNSG